MRKLIAISLFASALMIPFQAKATSSNTLIKSPDFSSVYYFDGEKRHAFPSESVFFSWYVDFSGVQTVTSQELGQIPLGSNVTMRPGTKLVKITSVPLVYAVEGQKLRPVSTEAVAGSIWGPEWAKQVVDIAETFFMNYGAGDLITRTEDYSPAVAHAGYGSIAELVKPVTPVIEQPVQTIQPTSTPQTSQNQTTQPTEPVGSQNTVTIEPCKVSASLTLRFSPKSDGTWLEHYFNGWTDKKIEYSVSSSHINSFEHPELMLVLKGDSIGMVSPIAGWDINEKDSANTFYTTFVNISTTGTHEYAFTCQKEGQETPSVTNVKIEVVE
jgi:hypothetical protein